MMRSLMQGLSLFKANTKLWVVGLLLIVVPILFTYFYQSSTEVASNNLTTVLSEKISVTHDAIEYVFLEFKDFDIFANELMAKQKDIKKLYIVSEVKGQFMVLYTSNTNQSAYPFEQDPYLKTALIEPGTTYIFNSSSKGINLSSAYRAIIKDEQIYFLFTEHDFSKQYQIFSAREDKVIVAIVFIFLMLIALTYWLAKQINYEKLYFETSRRLKERDLFMNSLVHELRAPLTAMRGYASMIEEATTVPEKEKEYATRIKISTTRLVTLVSDFLEAARIQSGKLPLEYSLVNLKDLIQTVISANALSATNKNLVLSARINTDALELMTDHKRLEQVLTNIISNSIKYTPQGSITVSLNKNFKDHIITIADTGSGISADDQQKLFSPFVRVGDDTQKQEVTGTGLGMWITKQLINQMGGTIAIESIKGVGTHVIVSLPSSK